MKKTEWVHELAINVSKLDIVNMETASIPLKEMKDQEFILSGMAVTEGTDRETGEVIYKGFMVAEGGDVYGSISETAIRSMVLAEDSITEAFGKGKRIKVQVNVRKSNAGRDFIVLKYSEVV